MEQSKKHSLVESCVKTAIGFVISYYAWKLMIIPVVERGYITLQDTFIITCFFTVLSIVRSYVVRRFFNWHLHRDN